MSVQWSRDAAGRLLPLACLAMLSCSDDPVDPDPDPTPAVAEIRLAVDTLALYPGESGELGAVAYDATGAPIDAEIVYTTSAPGIISVDENGAYTVQSHGSATLTATLDSISVTVPVRITRFVDLASMFDPVCALDGFGDVYCVGTEHHGNEFGPHPRYETWTRLSGTLPISDLTAGRWHACGLSSGRVYCWGASTDRQMGYGAMGMWSRAPVLADERSYHVVDAGWEHTCALDTTAAAWCWGRNDDGETGIGEASPWTLPTAVAGELEWRSIDAGDAATCGVATSGSTYCWGNINGSSAPALVEDVPADLDVLRVAWRGACGAKGADVYCWGESGGWFPDPASVTLPATVVDLAMGPASACALLATGEIHCWGSADDDLLGRVTTSAATAPVQIASDEHFVQLTGYQELHCALTDKGAVYCWGSWPEGVIEPSDVPLRVPAPRP